MTHDFARQHKNRQHKSKRPPAAAATRANQQARSHWPWYFSGLLSGMLLSSLLYFGLLRETPSTQETSDLQASTETSAPASGPQFGFYEYLPEAEVQVNVVPVAIVGNNPGNTTEEADPLNYLLQAGSFQNPADAQSRLASIRLLELEANIVPATVAGNTWHRVQVGPITGRDNVEQARRTLSASNIDTIVLQLR